LKKYRVDKGTGKRYDRGMEDTGMNERKPVVIDMSGDSAPKEFTSGWLELTGVKNVPDPVISRGELPPGAEQKMEELCMQISPLFNTFDYYKPETKEWVKRGCPPEKVSGGEMFISGIWEEKPVNGERSKRGSASYQDPH
jgi:hypothetical protein